MPNYVYNSLTITPLAEYTGDKKALVKKIKRKLEKTYTLDDGEKHKGFSFNNIIKMPQNKRDYDWRIANWGSKWDAQEVERHDDDDEDRLDYSFYTPWSHPSLQMLTKLCHEFPISISLRWEHEEGFGQELTIFKEMVFIDEDWEDNEEMSTKGTKDKPLTYEEILEWAMCECENCKEEKKS